MNLKEALGYLEPLASTPAQQDALETLHALAVERDEALQQADIEYHYNKKLNLQLDAALALIREMKK